MYVYMATSMLFSVLNIEIRVFKQKGIIIMKNIEICEKVGNSYIPFNSKFTFTPCRLHPASNGNSISESHPEYEGHAHNYVITSLRVCKG